MAKANDKIQKHLDQWKHNRSLIGQIPATHPDWVVTIVFYTAVQLIDAVLAHEDVSVSNHETRFKAIGAINRLKRVGVLYHPLYDLCRKVRYTANPTLWVPPDSIDEKIIRGCLLPLERSVENLLGNPLDAEIITLSWATRCLPVT